MSREELLKSPEYHIVNIQSNIFEGVENYMKDKGINRTEFAKQLGVSKGYVTQLLNGDFDSKISKMVELSLAIGKVPVLLFVDMEKFLKANK